LCWSGKTDTEHTYTSTKDEFAEKCTTSVDLTCRGTASQTNGRLTKDDGDVCPRSKIRD